MLQEKDAVEVVDFVAEGASQKIFAANLEGFALGVQRFYGDKLRPHNVTAEAGDREAAFFFADFAFGVGNFWIYENDFGFRIFPASDVNDGEANAFADLRRSEANSLRGVHRSEHVFGKFFKL